MVFLERLKVIVDMTDNGNSFDKPKKRLRKKKLLHPQQELKTTNKKESNIDKFAEQFKKKKREAEEAPSTRSGKYKTNPSRYPILNEWKMKGNSNRWRTLDWAGCWLNMWKECYGEEDPDYIGVGLKRSISYKEKFKNEIWLLGLSIEKFRDSDRCFRGDGSGTGEYIKWLFEDYLPSIDWMSGPISSEQAFRVTKNYFLRQFKVRETKVKKPNIKEPKGTGKWNPWGYTN